MALPPGTKVWRYMSFAKFVWMLQNKKLWLSNARFLGDNWEIAFDSSQINRLANKYALSMSTDAFMSRQRLIVNALRDSAFVSSWSASEYESHALWRIYCSTSEGVAIQTTLDRLEKSVHPPLFVQQVKYNPSEVDIRGIANDTEQLLIQKRPMFAYEQEVRVILIKDPKPSDYKKEEHVLAGVRVSWNPAEHIENIWIHPEAQPFFAECVTKTVKLLAPKLGRKVLWSKMKDAPPI